MNATAKLACSLAFAVLALSMSGTSYALPPASPVAAVRDILDASDDKLDYVHAKLKLDQIIDPSIKADKIDLSKTYTNEFARRAKERFKA